MAKIRDYAVSVEAATVTSMVCEMPTHEIGDLLIAAVNKDATPSFNTPAGWDVIQTQQSAGAYGGIYAKRAASPSEAVTFTYASETAMAIIVSIKGCYGTTVAHAISDSNVTGADDSTVPLDGGTITPSYDNSLIFSFLSTDTGLAPMALPGWVNIYGGDTGANSGALSYTYQKTKAAITHPSYWGLTQDDSRAFMVVVRDDTYETEVDAYVDRTTNPCTQLTPHMGLGTTAALIAANKGSWKTATPLTIASINGKTATWMAVSATADSGYNPFRSSTALAGTSSKTVLYGNQFTFTAPLPNLTLDTGVIFGTWLFTLPRDYVDIGKSSTGGMLTGIASSANGRFWCIGGQFAKTTLPDKRMNYAIEVSTTDTDYYTTGTPPTLSAITELYIINQSYFGATAVKFSELWLLNETVLAGGTTANPINFLDVVNAVNEGSGHIPLLVQQGSAATSWTRLRFGGGDPIHALVNLRTFQFPAKADGTDYLDFHVSNNVLGVEFYGKSGDELKFTNCVFTSDSSYYWRFNASHAYVTLDFSGTTVVNATVTLRSTVTLDRTTFIDCSSFTQNSAVLTNCTLSNTKITSATLDDMALISNCSFTSVGTGYAIEVSGSADTIDFAGNTFTGYAVSDGSTGNEAIYVNIGSGIVTLNITEDGGVPSIRTAGATVIVNKMVTLTVNGVSEGAVCYIEVTGGGDTPGTVLMNEAANASGIATEDYNYPDATVNVLVRARYLGYLPFETTGIITSSGLTVTAVWLLDPNTLVEASSVSVTFANANPDTITRNDGGDFILDGWDYPGYVTVLGSTNNDGKYALSSTVAITSSVLTLDGAESLTAEGPTTGVTLTWSRT